MRYTITEQKALKKLGIPDFTHMTKDKVAKFVTMLPKMNPEVAKAAIDKFPEFKELTLGIVNNYKASLDNILSANSESQKSFYDACNEIISSLQKELEDNSLTAEEKDRIENKLLIVADMINKKDSENKHFLAWILSGAAALAVALSALSSSNLGGNFSLNGHKDEDDEE